MLVTSKEDVLKRKLLITVLFVFLLIGNVSCSTIMGWFGKGEEEEVDTAVKVEPLRMEKFDMLKGDLEIDLIVMNKTSDSLTITGYDYKLTFGNGEHEIVVPSQKANIEVKEDIHKLELVR